MGCFLRGLGEKLLERLALFGRTFFRFTFGTAVVGRNTLWASRSASLIFSFLAKSQSCLVLSFRFLGFGFAFDAVCGQGFFLSMDLVSGNYSRCSSLIF